MSIKCSDYGTLPVHQFSSSVEKGEMGPIHLGNDCPSNLLVLKISRIKKEQDAIEKRSKEVASLGEEWDELNALRDTCFGEFKSGLAQLLQCAETAAQASQALSQPPISQAAPEPASEETTAPQAPVRRRKGRAPKKPVSIRNKLLAVDRKIKSLKAKINKYPPEGDKEAGELYAQLCTLGREREELEKQKGKTRATRV